MRKRTERDERSLLYFIVHCQALFVAYKRVERAYENGKKGGNRANILYLLMLRVRLNIKLERKNRIKRNDRLTKFQRTSSVPRDSWNSWIRRYSTAGCCLECNLIKKETKKKRDKEKKGRGGARLLIFREGMLTHFHRANRRGW